MKGLQNSLEEYLELRHRLGFKLRDTSGQLRRFVRFAREQKASHLSTQLALRWATEPTGCQPARWTARLSMLRQFAHYLSAMDPRTEIPPRGLLPYRYHRKTPYLLSQQQVLQLVQAAQQIPSPKGLRAATYSTLFGLLAATGIRLGEAIGLNCQEVDLNQGLLKIRQTKFNKSRWVPLHPTTTKKLQQYQQLREQCSALTKSPSFFVSEAGTRLSPSSVRTWFARLSQQIRLRRPTDPRDPHPHDLRHYFVIETLRRWYESHQDIEASLPKLATCLGHSHVRYTYWYISATPELLQLATQRLESDQGGPLP